MSVLLFKENEAYSLEQARFVHCDIIFTTTKHIYLPILINLKIIIYYLITVINKKNTILKLSLIWKIMI